MNLFITKKKNNTVKPIEGANQMAFRKKTSYNLFLSALIAIYRNYFRTRRSKFGYIAPTARVRFPITIKGIENIYSLFTRNTCRALNIFESFFPCEV